MLLLLLLLVSSSLSLKCTKMENKKCIPRDYLIKLNENGEPRYYPYFIETKRCLGSCNDIDNPMAKSCVSNQTKKIYVQVYDLLYNKLVATEINENLSCSCNCRFDFNVCNKGQSWDKDNCRCYPYFITDRIFGDECSEIIEPIKIKDKFVAISNKNNSEFVILLSVISFVFISVCLSLALIIYKIYKKSLTDMI